jgi:hypothetical protein
MGVTPAENASSFPVVRRGTPTVASAFKTALQRQNTTQNQAALSEASHKPVSQPERQRYGRFEKGTLIDTFA